jgi:transposase
VRLGESRPNEQDDGVHILISMPGVAVRTATKILTFIGDGSAIPTAGHLAADAGLAPVTRRSGSSIRGESPTDTATKPQELFLSAFASLEDPTSRAYYDVHAVDPTSETCPSHGTAEGRSAA